MKKRYDPLKVEKSDHPDIVGGIVWSDCELEWIRAYGTRCYNHGNAKGMEAGKLLFATQVGAGETVAVTNKMIGAAHDVMLAKGDFILSAALLERIYLAMTDARPQEKVSDGDTANELLELRAWREKAFLAHPNIDRDIEALGADDTATETPNA